MVNARLTLDPLSAAWILTLNTPAAVGVPLSAPVSPASDTPAGSAPDNTLHFTAPLLPLALNEAVYGCCKSPIGSCDVSMDSVVPGELGLVVGPGAGAGFELGVGFVACCGNALPPPHAVSAQQQSTATANADTHRVPQTRGMANCHIHRPVKPTQRAIRLTPLAKPPQVSNVTWHAPQRSLNSRGELSRPAARAISAPSQAVTRAASPRLLCHITPAGESGHCAMLVPARCW